MKNLFYKIKDFYLWCALYFTLNRNKKLKYHAAKGDKLRNHYIEVFAPWNYSTTFQDILRSTVGYGDQDMPTMWLYWNTLCESIERYHYVMNTKDNDNNFKLDYMSKENQENALINGDWEEYYG